MDPVRTLCVGLLLLRLSGGAAELKADGGSCFGRSCYMVFRQDNSFRAAQSLCEKLGAHLMTVRSSTHNDILAAILGTFNGSFWIGLQLPSRCPDPAAPLRGFQWVTKDSESDFDNWPSGSDSDCSDSRCVSVGGPGGFKWRRRDCSRPAEGFLCEHSFAEPCFALPGQPPEGVTYLTPYGFETELDGPRPPGSVATRRPDQTQHICVSGRWLQAPWSCEVRAGGCEHRCAVDPRGDPACFCPPGQAVNPANRVSCGPPAPEDPCAALRCQQLCFEDSGEHRCACGHGLRLAKDGRSCVDLDECADSRQCPGDNVQCVNSPVGFKCDCAAGYRRSRGGECVDEDECASAPCEQECTNTAGSYACSCFEGYRGDEAEPHRCKLFCGKDECPAVCDPNDPHACYCPDGYLLEERAGGSVCMEIDECAFSQCEQRCVNTFGGFVCFCEPGYTLVTEVRCVPDGGPERPAGPPDTPPTPAPSEPPRGSSAVTSGHLLGIIVFAVLALVLSVFGSFLARKSRVRRREDTAVHALKALQEDESDTQRAGERSRDKVV